MRVKDIMTRHVYTVHASDTVEHAPAVLAEHQITMVRTDDVLCRDVQYRLDEYAGGERRWTATVEDGMATVNGPVDDPTERDVIAVLARTVPGVSAVYLGAA